MQETARARGTREARRVKDANALERTAALNLREDSPEIQTIERAVFSLRTEVPVSNVTDQGLDLADLHSGGGHLTKR